MADSNITSKVQLREAHSALIKIAAELARGDGVPDWSGHKWRASTPASERTDVMCMLRGMDETVRLYAVRLKAIIDKVSAAITAPETSGLPATKYTGTREQHGCTLCGHSVWSHVCPPSNNGPLGERRPLETSAGTDDCNPFCPTPCPTHQNG